MPHRSTPLITDFYYHAYNQGIDRRKIFTSKREYDHALITMWFYQYRQSFIKLAHFLTAGTDIIRLSKRIEASPKLVDITAFCFMPNHFHFLLKQRVDKGISLFLADFQNSYTKYFNARHERKGSLLLNPFRALLVETDEQLLHLSRYIHLNPLSSAVVATTEELLIYPYSSLPEYLVDQSSNLRQLVTDPVLEHFKDNASYKQFVLDLAGYQQQLEAIKHLTHEHGS